MSASHPVPPALLLAIPTLSLALLSIQLATFLRSRSLHRSRPARDLFAHRRSAAFILASLALLALLSAALGLSAFAIRAQNPSRSADRALASQIALACLKFELGAVVIYLLNQRALVEPITSSTFFDFNRLRLSSIVLALLLTSCTIISIVIPALHSPYPAAALPALLWFLFLCPALTFSDLLYFRSRARAFHTHVDPPGSGRLSAIWLALGVAQVAAVLSAAFSAAPPGDDALRVPAALFTVLWAVFTSLASHALFFLPTHSPTALPLHSPPPLPRPAPAWRAHAAAPRPPSSSRPLSPASVQTMTSEDFTHLHDPFASPPPLSPALLPLHPHPHPQSPRQSYRYSTPLPLALPPTPPPDGTFPSASPRPQGRAGRRAQSVRVGLRGGQRAGGARPRVQKKGSARPLVPLASVSSSSHDSAYGSNEGEGEGEGEGEEDAFGDGGYPGHVGLGGGVGLGLELGPGEVRHARGGVGTGTGGVEEAEADGFAFVHGSAREEARLTQVLLRTLEEARAGAARGGGERRG